MSGANRWTIVAALAVGVLIGSAFVARPVVSQESEEGKKAADENDFRHKKPTEEEMQEGMKRWMETVAPSKHHRFLEKFLGEWDTAMTMWMDQDAPPMQTKGTATYQWAVEGKWLIGRDEGMMMGTPWKGDYFLGYDNFKKKFVGASISSMSTTLLTYEGGLDKTGTELMLWGSVDEPMTGEHDKPVRYHWKFEGKDKISIEVHDLMIGGDNTKVIQVDYERKKAK